MTRRKLPTWNDDGAVVINDGWPIVWKRGVRVWEFDLVTKYARFYAVDWPAGLSGVTRVALMAAPDSLHARPDTDLDAVTYITLPPVRGGYDRWQVLADVSRYTLDIVAWRMP